MADIETIFFDIDGTLVDSRKDIVTAMNYTMRELGLQTRPASLIVSYVGTGVKDLVRKSLGLENAGLADKGVEIFSSYYVKHSADQSTLYPHAKEILDYFKNKRKFVITNRFKKFAEATLTELGVKDYFEEVLAGDDEDCMKPSSCVLDTAFARLKIDNKKAMIIGDMVIDIETGKNSGVKTCWVTYGLGKKADFKDIKPDYIIDDLIELKNIIK